MPSIAAESRQVPLTELPSAFRILITELRSVIKGRDKEKVYSFVAPDYFIKRDFGGDFDAHAPAVQNFSMDFQFDNSKLGAEYQDHGWKTLERFINQKMFVKQKSGEIWTPAAKRQPPETQLCFRKTTKGNWVIAGIIRGGD